MKRLTWWIVQIVVTALMVAGISFGVFGAKQAFAALACAMLLFALRPDLYPMNDRVVSDELWLVSSIVRACYLAWFGEAVLAAIVFGTYFAWVWSRSQSEKEAGDAQIERLECRVLDAAEKFEMANLQLDEADERAPDHRILMLCYYERRAELLRAIRAMQVAKVCERGEVA